MKTRFLFRANVPCASLISASALLAISLSPLRACGDHGLSSSASVSQSAALSDAEIEAYRDQGQPGLDALFQTYANAIRRTLIAPEADRSKDARWQQIAAVLDAVSQQHDSFASKLFWYTDIEEAKAVARRTGKPILSLRLLGKLNEDFSCANSRFFRTVLYANEGVARQLRDRFILHWESVRPVPKVTIDFGDGRVLNRTVTGNSIHYVLDADGNAIDALPGLYGPGAFLKGLATAERAEREARQQPESARSAFLQRYHRERLAEIVERWSAEVAQQTARRLESAFGRGAKPSALIANNRTVAKAQAETTVLRALAPSREVLTKATDDVMWGKLAQLHASDAQLDHTSRALMQIKNPHGPAGAPSAREAGLRAITKAVVEDPMVRAMRNLERSIAEDTVRNEYLFHSAIHEWFANGSAPMGLPELNEKVYAELFLTPSSDPWLGLLPADTYSGLDANGIAGTMRGGGAQ